MKVTTYETLYHEYHGATLKHKCGKRDSSIVPSLFFSHFILFFYFFTCCSLQIILSQNYLLPLISVLAENTLLETAYHSNDVLPQIALGLREQASWMHTHLVSFVELSYIYSSSASVAWQSLLTHIDIY